MSARRFVLLAWLVLAAPAPVLAQAPARQWSGPPRLVDAARLQQIAFAVPTVGRLAPKPGKIVEANVYSPDRLVPLEPAPLSPATAEAQHAEQALAEAARSAQAFGYVLEADVDRPGPPQMNGFPADCHVAAGFQHVLATINSHLRIYDKQARLLVHVSLDSLLGTAPGWTGCFDPKVRFDAVRNRFYVLALDRHSTLPQGAYRLACSLGPDPTLGWRVWELRNELGGLAIDYEEMGFGPRAMYLSGNYFKFQGWTNTPTIPATGSCWVLDLDAIVAGNNFSFYRFDDLRGTQNEIITTAKTPGSGVASAPGIDAVTIGQGQSPNAGQRRALFWGWSVPPSFPAAAPTATQQFVEIGPTNPVPNAPQRGGPAQLQANNIGSAFLGASISGGRIAAAMPVESGGAVNVRAYEFDVSAWPTVTTTNAVDLAGGSSTSRYWPNSARNEFGEQVLVWSQSSTSEYVGARWAVRQRDQSTFAQEGSVCEGWSYYGALGDMTTTLYRWGDYAGVDVDPVDQGFWCLDSYAAGYSAFDTDLVHVPHVEYVDNTGATAEFGTRTNPRTQLSSAALVARPGNPIVVRASTYTVPVNFVFSSATQLVPDGGPVTIIAP